MTAYGRLPRKTHDIKKEILEEHARYIAGFLDGEGTFTIRWNKNAPSPSFQPLIMLAHTHEGAVEHVADTFGVSYEPREKPNKRTFYLMRVTTKPEIVRILNALSEYLIVKDEHAKIILELIALKEKKEFTREIVTKMAELYLRIRQLNPKGSHFDPVELKSALNRYIDNYFR